MAIDLEQDYSKGLEPSSPSTKHYPNLHIECDEDLEIPEEGELTVTFKRSGQTERTDKEGNCTYSYDLDICTIESVDGKEVEESDDAGGKNYDDASGALDKIMEAIKAKA